MRRRCEIISGLWFGGIGVGCGVAATRSIVGLSLKVLLFVNEVFL